MAFAFAAAAFVVVVVAAAFVVDNLVAFAFAAAAFVVVAAAAAFVVDNLVAFAFAAAAFVVVAAAAFVVLSPAADAGNKPRVALNIVGMQQACPFFVCSDHSQIQPVVASVYRTACAD